MKAIRCASLSTRPTSAASAVGTATLGVRWSLTYAKLGKNLGFIKIQVALEALDEAHATPLSGYLLNAEDRPEFSQYYLAGIDPHTRHRQDRRFLILIQCFVNTA